MKKIRNKVKESIKIEFEVHGGKEIPVRYYTGFAADHPRITCIVEAGEMCYALYPRAVAWLLNRYIDLGIIYYLINDYFHKREMERLI